MYRQADLEIGAIVVGFKLGRRRNVAVFISPVNEKVLHHTGLNALLIWQYPKHHKPTLICISN